MTAAHATMCSAFQETVTRNPGAVAVRTAGDTITLTFGAWGARVRELAGGFAALGVGRGAKVALMMANRPEFYPIDTAVVHLGAVPFSMYNTSSPEQVHHLLADSAPPRFRRHCEIEDMQSALVQLVDHEADHPVAMLGHHANAVPLPQAAYKVLFKPRELEAAALDVEHLRHVAANHPPNVNSQL